jgi:hypothetical protein
MTVIWEAYTYWLINNGVPAEEARGLLPHDTLTRLHHKVNLRNLDGRTRQAALYPGAVRVAHVHADLRRRDPRVRHSWQFKYRGVDAVCPDLSTPAPACRRRDRGCTIRERVGGRVRKIQPLAVAVHRGVAAEGLFVPICFQKGACMFKASMDRGCTIRERVEHRGEFDGRSAVEEWRLDPTRSTRPRGVTRSATF